MNYRFCVQFQGQSGDDHEKEHCSMATEVETKDCTMLGAAEIEEMADLCA